MKRTYLDHNATTPVAPEVAASMAEAMHLCGNPSSIHWEGRQARQALERSRQQVASLLSAHLSEITFTSGGTEANGIALRSHLAALTNAGLRDVLMSAGEHPCVKTVLESASQSGQIDLRVVPLESSGALSTEAVISLLTPRTGLVAFMAFNNETGCEFPIAELARLVREKAPKARIHCDAVQAIGRIAVKPSDLGVDTLSGSAHKFYGPKGVGLLWTRSGLSLLTGKASGQERGVRPGTENLVGIVGLGEAAALAQQSMDSDAARIGALRDRLEERLCREIPDCHINGAEVPRLSTTTNLRFAGVPGDLLQQALDLRGFAVSTGSACSSGTLQASPVLVAMGQESKQAMQAIRISLGRATTEAEIDALCRALGEAIPQIRASL